MMASTAFARAARPALLRPAQAALVLRPCAPTPLLRRFVSYTPHPSIDPAQAEQIRHAIEDEEPQPEVDQSIRAVAEPDTETILSRPGMEQGTLYLDAAFSIALGAWDPRRGLTKIEAPNLLEKLRSSLPPSKEIGYDFQILSVRGRPRDGGAFLYFAYQPRSDAPTLAEQRADSLISIQQTLQRHIERSSEGKRLATLSPVPGVHIVRGKPWIEDLDLWPSSRVKAKLSSAAGEQTVWEALRPYGRIRRIQTITPGAEYKVVFSRLRAAAAAKNCAHLMRLPAIPGAEIGTLGPTIRLNYEQRSRANDLAQWASNHPKVMMPVIFALLGIISVSLLDPLRSWMVEQHIRDVFDPNSYQLWQWVKRTSERLRQEGDALLGVEADDDHSADAELWRDRSVGTRTLVRLLQQTPTTFITLTGPRGSGKSELLGKALGGNHLVLELDAGVVAKAARKGDVAQLGALAQQTGYWPSLSWLNRFAGLADLAAAGLIGSKPGFATPPEQQLKQLLTTVTQSLTTINQQEAKAAEQREKKVVQARAKAQARDLVHTPSSTASHALAVPAQEASTEAAAETVVEGAWNKVISFIPSFGTLQSPEPEADGKAPTSTPDQAAAKAAETGGAAVTTAKGDTVELEHTDEPPTASISAEARHYPAVVIRNFRQSGVKDEVLYTTLAEWGAELVQSEIANVVFVSDDPAGMNKDLARALPNKPFEAIALADADLLRARRIVAAKIKELAEQEEQAATAPVAGTFQARLSALGSSTSAVHETTKEEAPSSTVSKAAQRLRSQLDTSPAGEASGGLRTATAEWVDKLGGRQTDLSDLVEKLKLGQTVQSAVQSLIGHTAVALQKTFGEDIEEAASLPWSQPQAWGIISKLAKTPQGELPYYGVLFGTFKGQEASLKALESAEVITIRHVDGRPSLIRPGRPVFLHAMRALVADPVFAATQVYQANKARIAYDEGVISKVETELKTIKEAGMDYSAAGRQRARFLLDSVAEAEAELEKLYAENLKLLARLNTASQ